MKHLPKHVRPRWRYLAIEIESHVEAKIARRSFQRALWFAAQNFIGDAGSAALDTRLFEFHFTDGDGEAVLRVRRDGVERLRAVLATIDEIDGYPIGIFVRGVSGTVRACEEKYIRRPKVRFKERIVTFAGADRHAAVRNDRIDIGGSDGPVGATALDIRDN